MKMEQTECSDTSAYKIQTPGNYPEESIQHSEHSESLKSRKHSECYSVLCTFLFDEKWNVIKNLKQEYFTNSEVVYLILTKYKTHIIFQEKILLSVSETILHLS
jgi:nicotinic acid phosphoribosyltransferase